MRLQHCAGETQRKPRLGAGKPLQAIVDIMGGMDLPYLKSIDFALPGNRTCGVCSKNMLEHLREYCGWISDSRYG